MSDILDTVMVVLGVDGKQRGDEYDFHCPVHADRKPSCGINLTTGLWHCFVCGAGGNLTDLAMAVKGVDRHAARRLVQATTPEAMRSALHRRVHTALNGLKRKPPIKLPGPYAPEPLDYMRGRGFTDETLMRYGVGYVEQETFQLADRSYSIRDYIAIPIRDRAQHLLAYVYRATGPSGMRYLYTPGFPKASVWFGTDLYPGGTDIVVTEGSIDSMWISQAGHPAIAALGASAEHKTATLMRYRSVILFMDRDAAGVHAARRLGQLLARRIPVRVVRYPTSSDATDPAELSDSQVRRAIRRAVPYHAWVGLQ